ncbi:hypothetical protein RHSIM_Rhsim12G0141400 [Rhododendron simsii]|uniref:Uncharacterized protein n=1 Tax=Rhododendron simsii TaxID=118357 RepID=A0A834L6K1_RHOSS|nr:hypothetical protein RHSIM_Rhsim12G0141400 [Rhododendron simsii]
MEASIEQTKPSIPADVDVELQWHIEGLKVDQVIDNYCSTRSQWLRAAVLGANDGLLSTASLMVGVGAFRKDVKTMVLTRIAGLVAGAYRKRGSSIEVVREVIRENEIEERKGKLPSPFQAATASALSFSIGAFVPLLAAGFISDYKVRLGVVAAAVSLALLGFGGLSAVLGRAPVVKPSLRVLVGGWSSSPTLASMSTVAISMMRKSCGRERQVQRPRTTSPMVGSPRWPRFSSPPTWACQTVLTGFRSVVPGIRFLLPVSIVAAKTMLAGLVDAGRSHGLLVVLAIVVPDIRYGWLATHKSTMNRVLSFTRSRSPSYGSADSLISISRRFLSPQVNPHTHFVRRKQPFG